MGELMIESDTFLLFAGQEEHVEGWKLGWGGENGSDEGMAGGRKKKAQNSSAHV